MRPGCEPWAGKIPDKTSRRKVTFQQRPEDHLGHELWISISCQRRQNQCRVHSEWKGKNCGVSQGQWETSLHLKAKEPFWLLYKQRMVWRFSKSERKETQGWLGVRVVSRETASEMEKRKRVVDIWRENQPVLSGDQTGAGGQYFSLFCVDLYA